MPKEERKKSVCIVCGKERDGLEVKEDSMLGIMRWIKKNITKSPKNYRLVVCKDDFLAYKKKKDGYDRKQVIYVSLGILFLIILLAFSHGRFLGAFFYGAIIIVFLYLLSQLSYVPSVNMPAMATEKKNKRNKSK